MSPSPAPTLQPGPHPRPRPSSRLGLLALGCWLAGAAQAAYPDPGPDWQLAGQQGLVRYLIVPADLARDKAAYERQIARLCEPERTCFLNFYTNSQGAVVGLPLPDAIEHEATATFRRSAKNGAERFWWSCRLQMVGETCF
jgi:hypothetical protein